MTWADWRYELLRPAAAHCCGLQQRIEEFSAGFLRILNPVVMPNRHIARLTQRH